MSELVKVARLTGEARRTWDEFVAGSRLRRVSAPDGTVEWTVPADWSAEEAEELRAVALRMVGLMRQVDPDLLGRALRDPDVPGGGS
ncbi:hypothetical protein HUT13_01065 [Streptomyces harbinensis]|uniref:hypothetical protein n=1 Tax=Streptomyces harbinensis TaxID=1176198 RepID=UPI001590B481|nr:hypothetical protein [Streptomyces harbinensis]QKV67512.1 hypothetical protein HUT13_01065 [Streptomyces harbinensis]